jgi:CheY-like chemotaxis protein
LACQALESDGYNVLVATSGESALQVAKEEAGATQGGTGLGLAAIAQRHVEMMGGELSLESREGEVSRFSFTIEMSTGNEKAGSKQEENWVYVTGFYPGTTIRVLIIDDVKNNRDILARMLTRLGIEVETAENDDKVLELARKKLPNLVILEIRMPGMSGPEVLENLLEEHGRGTPEGCSRYGFRLRTSAGTLPDTGIR